MPADDPREPRFEPFAQERLAPPEPIRIDPSQIRPSAEPIEPPEGSRSLVWLLVGVAAAVVLVIVIILATRRPANPPPTAAASPPVRSETAATEPPVPADNPAAQPSAAATAQVSGTAPIPTAPPPATAPTAVAPKGAAPATSPQLPSRTAPAVPAPQPSAPAAAEPATKPAASATAAVSPHGPKHRRRAPSADAPWLVQVGAFKSSESAHAVLQHLAKDGWKARTANGAGGWKIVEVIGYRSRADAEKAAKALTAKSHVPTLVRRAKIATPPASDRTPHGSTH